MFSAGNTTAGSFLSQAVRASSFPFFKTFLRWQDASAVSCLCVWIVASVEPCVAAEAVGPLQDPVEGHIWGLEDLSVIWRTLLMRQKIRTLIRGFQLFFKVVLVHVFPQFKGFTSEYPTLAFSLIPAPGIFFSSQQQIVILELSLI